MKIDKIEIGEHEIKVNGSYFGAHGKNPFTLAYWRELKACHEACREIMEYDEEGLQLTGVTAKEFWDIVKSKLEGK